MPSALVLWLRLGAILSKETKKIQPNERSKSLIGRNARAPFYSFGRSLPRLLENDSNLNCAF